MISSLIHVCISPDLYSIKAVSMAVSRSFHSNKTWRTQNQKEVHFDLKSDEITHTLYYEYMYSTYFAAVYREVWMLKRYGHWVLISSQAIVKEFKRKSSESALIILYVKEQHHLPSFQFDFTFLHRVICKRSYMSNDELSRTTS